MSRRWRPLARHRDRYSTHEVGGRKHPTDVAAVKVPHVSVLPPEQLASDGQRKKRVQKHHGYERTATGTIRCQGNEIGPISLDMEQQLRKADRVDVLHEEVVLLRIQRNRCAIRVPIQKEMPTRGQAEKIRGGNDRQSIRFGDPDHFSQEREVILDVFDDLDTHRAVELIILVWQGAVQVRLREGNVGAFEAAFQEIAGLDLKSAVLEATAEVPFSGPDVQYAARSALGQKTENLFVDIGLESQGSRRSSSHPYGRLPRVRTADPRQDLPGINLSLLLLGREPGRDPGVETPDQWVYIGPTAASEFQRHTGA